MRNRGPWAISPLHFTLRDAKSVDLPPRTRIRVRELWSRGAARADPGNDNLRPEEAVLLGLRIASSQRERQGAAQSWLRNRPAPHRRRLRAARVGGNAVRIHPVRHDPTREHGAVATRRGRPRKNKAVAQVPEPGVRQVADTKSLTVPELDGRRPWLRNRNEGDPMDGPLFRHPRVPEINAIAPHRHTFCTQKLELDRSLGSAAICPHHAMPGKFFMS